MATMSVGRDNYPDFTIVIVIIISSCIIVSSSSSSSSSSTLVRVSCLRLQTTNTQTHECPFGSSQLPETANNKQ